MAATLGTAITPAEAAAPFAPRGNNRRPRHLVAASRSQAAPARRFVLRACASPIATADAPDETVTVSASTRPAPLMHSVEQVKSTLRPHAPQAAQLNTRAYYFQEPSVEPALETKLSKLACPICYCPLVGASDQSGDTSSLECSSCKKVYPNKQDYWDLTVAVGSTEYSESMPAITELFRTLLYLQFETAIAYLKPTIGGTIVDASCGSGLFSRLFVKSGLYSLVVALDFSENMLKQCNEYLRQESISDEYDSDH
nr:unnamed protein product [Digitaria exilis]CAB3503954.1 unnamed protein product [Digitaria exilis]